MFQKIYIEIISKQKIQMHNYLLSYPEWHSIYIDIYKRTIEISKRPQILRLIAV